MKIAPKLERARQPEQEPQNYRTGRRHADPVRVHIDELVLQGFAPADRHRIAGAVETELARLMRNGGGPGGWQSSSVLERINGGAFQVAPGAQPQKSGTQIAEAIYRSLRQSSAQSRPRSGNGAKPLGVRSPGQQQQ